MKSYILDNKEVQIKQHEKKYCFHVFRKKILQKPVVTLINLKLISLSFIIHSFVESYTAKTMFVYAFLNALYFQDQVVTYYVEKSLII